LSTSRLHLRRALPLALPLTLALAGGCAVGGDQEPVAQESAADTSIPPQTQRIAARLGQGWDRTAESFKAQCVTSSTVHVGQREGTILSDSTVDTSGIEDELGFSIRAKGRYAMVDASLAASLSQSMKQDDYSEVFVYKADYKLGSDSLDESTLHNTPVGDDAQQHVRWQDQCGDEVVYQIKNGAKFYFVQRIDFISREAKSKFESDAHVAFNSGVASGQVDAVLNQIGARYAKSARVHIELYQFGGNPAALGAVVNGTGGQASGAQAVVDCDMTNLAACKRVRENAVRYTDPANSSGLYAQLADPAFAMNPISYETKSWSILGRNTTPRILTQQITTARNQLELKFDALLKWKVRIDRILYTLAGFAVPPQQQTELNQWKTRLSGDLAIVNQAVVACYDNLTFDPSGTPLATKVTACTNAVDLVPNDQPPARLLTAAGRYAIDYRWQLLGGLGSPVGNYDTSRPEAVAVGRDQIGLDQQFLGGHIYWSPDTDAHEVYGYILDRYLSLGGANPNGRLELGFPTTGELPAKSPGRYNAFQGGMIYWSPNSGAHEVHGDIFVHWRDLGSEYSPLGFPTTDETPTIDNYGRFNHFEGGSMFWSPATGAHVVWGWIRDLWGNQGWERSAYGYPTTDEIWEQGGDWRFNDFQGGSIYYNDTLARQQQPAMFELNGAIGIKYKETRYLGLGYPTGTRAVPTARRWDGAQGWYQTFQNGAIYWHPTFGAHEVHGSIYAKWRDYGFELGRTLHWVSGATLGYPVTDERKLIKFGQEIGRYTAFEGGIIYWGPNSGAHIIAGTFYTLYQQWGFEQGLCGLPVDEPGWHEVTFGRNYYRQNFQNGYMKFFPSSGGTEVHCPSDGD